MTSETFDCWCGHAESDHGEDMPDQDGFYTLFCYYCDCAETYNANFEV